MRSETAEKGFGRFYTPRHIVCAMLDIAGYQDTCLLQKHIMEPGCGDGAFLVEIVRRYCTAAQTQGVSAEQIASELGNYIHGIEIDAAEHQKCMRNINAVAAAFGVENVCWDVLCGDALSAERFRAQMDFVVGNPPYVRVHNLSNLQVVKQFQFAENGMTDLYIAFYEIGLSMLNASGALCYINPSSLFNSVAAGELRRVLIQEKLLEAVVDLQHHQPFDATTYTAIFRLSKKNRTQSIHYFTFDGQNPSFADTLAYKDFYINGAFYFADQQLILATRNILQRQPKRTILDVKNGFATLCDRFFIGDFPFDNYTIPIVKASTGKRTTCLFPYDKNGDVIPYEALTQNPQIKQHYNAHSETLRARSLEKNGVWYAFGRSQGIRDVPKQKYAVNALIRNCADIKLTPCAPGVGVYGGLYILTDIGLDALKVLLFADAFVQYVTILGKYKSGGYYTYSSKDLLRYLEVAYEG